MRKWVSSSSLANIWSIPFTASAGTPLSILIAGLATDGLTAKLDRLWVFAQATQAEALVDIIAGATATLVNSPTFTANRGFTGNGTTSYIDTNFNGFTAPSPFYVRDSAHWSHWNLTNSLADQGYSGNGNDDASWQIFAGLSYPRTNDAGGADSVADPRGFMLGSRTSATDRASYQNGTLLNAIIVASRPVRNNDFLVLWEGVGGTSLSATEVAAYSIGGGLNSTEVTNLYNRLRTYMTAVGVP